MIEVHGSSRRLTTPGQRGRWLRYGLRLSRCIEETEPARARKIAREHDKVCTYLDRHAETRDLWERREITYSTVLALAEGKDTESERPNQTNQAPAKRRRRRRNRGQQA